MSELAVFVETESKGKREKRTEAEMFAACRTKLDRVNYIGSRVKKLRMRESELLAMLTDEERELIKQYG